MSYKGYTGHYKNDDKAEIFRGQVSGIRDVVTFQGRSVDELKRALKDSIDDYLEMCEEEGKAPDKPFSGKFSPRLTPGMHAQVASAAALSNKSINAWIADIVANALPTMTDESSGGEIETRGSISEGMVKKGGVNARPTSARPRPPAPTGQGGSSSSSAM